MEKLKRDIALMLEFMVRLTFLKDFLKKINTYD